MKVRLNRNEPNSAQKRILHQECVKEFDKLLEVYNKEVALQVLHILRFDFNFGQERLKRFAKRLNEMRIENMDRYLVTDEEVPDICEIQLRNSGIDVKSLLEG